MPQKTLDGKTDCRGVKGTCTVKFSGKAGDNPQVQEILDGLQEVHEKYPCVKITINRKPLKEYQKEWDMVRPRSRTKSSMGGNNMVHVWKIFKIAFPWSLLCGISVYGLMYGIKIHDACGISIMGGSLLFAFFLAIETTMVDYNNNGDFDPAPPCRPL